MRDMFLDALSVVPPCRGPAPVAQTAPALPPTPPAPVARKVDTPAADLAAKLRAIRDRNTMPDHHTTADADLRAAIDAMVAELVRAGDVVWCPETDQYRAPHYRRFRFGEA